MSLAPPQHALVLAPGYKLDRYELLCPIAEGGMGVCWLARMVGKHGFQKLVAIKTMKSEYASDPIFQQMFLDEARIASRIEHVNVAQILDLGEENGVLYLVMEYIDGDSLAKLQREVGKKSLAIPPGIVLRLLADTCAGLHAAHELTDDAGKLLGVIHRDVSPQNVLVTVKGTAKLIDFGIAKARDRTSGETSTGTIKGKIHYMAAEQAVGRGDIDRRADIFSVGAILYQMLSGRRAFEAETQVATILLLANQRPPQPLPKTVAPPIAAVVLRALSHTRALRYGTALQMQDAIEEAMIKCDLVTSTSTVAAFMAEHLGHRAQSRKKATDVALQLVNNGMFDIPAPMSSPTIGSSITGTPIELASALPQATRVGIGPVLEPGAGPPVGETQVAAAPEGARQAALMAVLALNTDGGGASPTLAASAVSHGLPNATRRRLVPLVVWVGGPALALVGVVLTLLALRHAGPVAQSSVGAGPSATEMTTEPSAAVHPPPGETASIAVPAPSLAPFARTATAATAVTATVATAMPRPSSAAAPPKATVSTPPAVTAKVPATAAPKKKTDDDGF